MLKVKDNEKPCDKNPAISQLTAGPIHGKTLKTEGGHHVRKTMTCRKNVKIKAKVKRNHKFKVNICETLTYELQFGKK